MPSAMEILCDILIEQNLSINKAIKSGKNIRELTLAYNKNAIKAIKSLQKKVMKESKSETKKLTKTEPKAKPVMWPINRPLDESDDEPINEPKPKPKSSKEIEEEHEYNKLMRRFEKFKDDRLQ